MDISVLLLIVSLVLAAVVLVQSRARNLLAWAVVATDLALLWNFFEKL